MPPLVSVVVPVFNVAPYLEQCLDSLLAQTLSDLDVVVVDDGSTDGSGDIAARYADCDSRVRLVRTPNGGLGKARNVGVQHTRGDLLCFLDSDDVLPFRAYELLHAAIEKSGSDFATGNFRRLTSRGTRVAKYVGTTYSRQRLRTHIREYRDLVVDRTAWNKMFRREFWERHDFRFAEGVQYEDQYVTLPAHFLAASVDVVSSPVCFWRIRDDDSSISQQREEPVAVRDRLTAIETTSRFLADGEFAADKPWYEQSVLAQDLSYFLDVIAALDPPARAPLLAHATRWLDQTRPDVFDRLPAIRRVGWHLARTARIDELVELLRFERDDLACARPVRRRDGWYGDYPFFRDRGVGVPDDLYRLDSDLRVDGTVTAIAYADGVLRVEGRAAIAPLGAPRRWSQRVSVAAVSAERDPLPFTVRRARVPDRDDAGADLDVVRGGGYVATLDVAELPADTTGDWQVEVDVRSRRVVRSTREHPAAPLSAPGPVLASLGGRRRLRVELTGRGELLVHVEKPKAVATAVSFDDDAGAVVIDGEVWAAADTAELEVTREAGRRIVCPAELTETAPKRRAFRACIPVADLVGGLDSPIATEAVRRQRLEVWELALRAGGAPARIAPPEDLPDRTWTAAGAQWRLETGRAGRLVLVHRAPRPIVTGVATGPGATVRLALRAPQSDATVPRVVLADRAGERHDLPAEPADEGYVVTVAATSAPPGQWDLLDVAAAEPVPLALAAAVVADLPVRVSDAATRVVLGVVGTAAPAVAITRWR